MTGGEGAVRTDNAATSVPDFGPPPSPDLVCEPTPEEVRFFHEHGYLVVERLTTEEELDWLKQIMTWIFRDEANGLFAPVDRSGTRADGEAPTLRQAFFPEIRFPAILDTTFRRNAHRYAAALLGRSPEELTTWGHMILKPARTGRAALWHQDAAYWEPELDYHALGCWLPLHEVTVDQGAMQFIPGSHRGEVYPHRHVDRPEHNVLQAVGVDDSDAVACPLPAGGATFHHFRTLHYTAPNTTERDRLALPMEYQIAPTVRASPRRMPWVDERRAVVGAPDPILYAADGRIVSIEAGIASGGDE